eukprot:763893-Hanusia_phi.AAC.2
MKLCIAERRGGQEHAQVERCDRLRLQPTNTVKQTKVRKGFSCRVGGRERVGTQSGKVAAGRGRQRSGNTDGAEGKRPKEEGDRDIDSEWVGVVKYRVQGPYLSQIFFVAFGGYWTLKMFRLDAHPDGRWVVVSSHGYIRYRHC